MRKKMRMENNRKTITVQNLFILFTIIGLGAAFFSLYLSEGYNWKFLIWNGDTVGIFPDLFESIGDGASGDPYGRRAIYPAFAYLICGMLGRLIPDFDCDNWYGMSTTRAATVIAFFFYFFSVWALIQMTEKVLNGRIRKWLILLFVCSAPFIFMLERGNMVIISLAGCMFFICYYDSENSSLRQFSYLALAFAAALKIYPAVLGILVVQKKKIKEILCLVSYGILAFLIPFFFYGGLDGILQMFENISSLSNATLTSTRGFGYGFKINIHNFFAVLGDYTGCSLDVHASVVMVVVAVLLLIASFVCTEKWKKVCCLCLLLTIAPTFSWIYNAIYMLPPFVLFLQKRGEESNWKSWVPLVLFMGIFLPLPYGQLFTTLDGANKVSLSTMVCSLSLYLLAIGLIGESLVVLPERIYGNKE